MRSERNNAAHITCLMLHVACSPALSLGSGRSQITAKCSHTIICLICKWKPLTLFFLYYSYCFQPTKIYVVSKRVSLLTCIDNSFLKCVRLPSLPDNNVVVLIVLTLARVSGAMYTMTSDTLEQITRDYVRGRAHFPTVRSGFLNQSTRISASKRSFLPLPFPPQNHTFNCSRVLAWAIQGTY